MPRILADTGPLYAHAMKRDGLHGRARTELSRLVAESYTLVIPQPILLETHKLILRREAPSFAARYLDALIAGSKVVNPLAEHYRAGLEVAKRFRDQKLSLYDTTLSVLSRTFGLPIWTFDADFDILGAQVWRPA